MIDQHWTPIVSIALAYKWLNIDTYWEAATQIPAVLEPNSLSQQAVQAKADICRGLSPSQKLETYPQALIHNFPLTHPLGSTARRSRLRDLLEPDLCVQTTLEQLVGQMRQDMAAGAWGEARARMSQIESICVSLQTNSTTRVADPCVLGEVRLEFGLAYRVMGENAQALENFLKAIKTFLGSDWHAEAVARWLAGYIQLETPRQMLNDGIVNWRRSWEIFAHYTAENKRPKPERDWYTQRTQWMAQDLQQAIENEGIAKTPNAFRSPESQPPPKPASGAASAFRYATAGACYRWASTPIRLTRIVREGSVPGVTLERLDGAGFQALEGIPAGTEDFVTARDFESMLMSGELEQMDELSKTRPDASLLNGQPTETLADTWLRLAVTRAYASIAAHPRGRTVKETPNSQPDYIECEYIWIKNARYRLFDLSSGKRLSSLKRIDLNETDHFVRVNGDSMDRAQPNPIEAGDYVLIREMDEPTTNQIVAVRLRGDTPLDDPCTIKRYYDELLWSDSSTDYPPIEYGQVERVIGHVMAVAKRVN
ncbi:MAG: LexA family protein [Anaerolineales bacterium]